MLVSVRSTLVRAISTLVGVRSTLVGAKTTLVGGRSTLVGAGAGALGPRRAFFWPATSMTSVVDERRRRASGIGSGSKINCKENVVE